MPATDLTPSIKTFGDDCFPPGLGGAHSMLHQQYQISQHRHDFMELVVTKAGTGEHWFEDRWHRLVRGTAFIVPVGAEHAFRNGGGLAVHHLILRDRFLADHSNELWAIPGYAWLFAAEPRLRSAHAMGPGITLDDQGAAAIDQLFAIIEGECAAPHPEPVGIDALALHLISRICRAARPPDTRIQASAGDAHQAVRRMLDLLETRWNQPFDADALATAAQRSPDSASRLLRNAVGLTPTAFLHRLRVQRALRLLTRGGDITSVALECGFCDGAHFARVCRKLTGRSPAEHRAAGRTG